MKRFLDVLLSLGGLAILAPLFALTSLLIWLVDGRPVFFRQERIGYLGQPFRIWKFRTMVPQAEQLGGQLTVGRDARVTRTGRWLRPAKLDELPQLLNVLSGEMSFVGPRPEVPYYVDQYTSDQREVLLLMPGITDAASIRFRNESELLGTADDPEDVYLQTIVPEKIRLNLEYARQATVADDLSTIGKTITCLLRAG